MSLIYKPIFSILLNALSLFLLLKFVPEITFTGGIWFFVIGGVILGLLNLFVRPFLKLLSLPLVFLTGGLFLIVINGFILWFLSYFMGVLNFYDVALVFPNFISYAIGAVVFGVINFATNLFFK